MSKTTIRDYLDSDIEAATQITYDAWAEEAEQVPPGFVQAEIRFLRLGSTWAKVALVSDEVAGLLFGRVEREFGLTARIRFWGAFIGLMLKAALGLYGRLPHRFTFLAKYALTEMRFVRNRPATEAEVVFLTAAPEHHGHGLGRELVVEFLDEARRQGARTVVVATDETSNWGFYEHLGFKRRAEFANAVDSYLLGKPIAGFTYLLDL